MGTRTQTRFVGTILASMVALSGFVAACGSSDDGGAGGSPSSGFAAGADGGQGGSAARPGTGDVDNGGFITPDASSSPPNPAADAACAESSDKARQIPLDLYVMLDQSNSMDDKVSGGTKWTAVTAALGAFFDDASLAGVGVGLGYFGIKDPGGDGDSCTATDYAKAEVEIAALPGASASLKTSIAKHAPSTDTPTLPALTGALAHAKAWASAHPGRTTVVVFATDGEPTECSSRTDLSPVNEAAASARGGSPSISTFVIGVGTSTGNLDGIASAGGTTKAFLVDTAGDVKTQFLAALQAIRGAALGCSYAIPVPEAGQVDFGSVNVGYLAGGAAHSIRIPKVTSRSLCPSASATVNSPSSAWYYDDESSPSKIILCDATCSVIAADPRAEVDILTGCATEVVR